MANASVFAPSGETATGDAIPRRDRALRGLVPFLVLVVIAAPAFSAELPTAPSDEVDRAWYVSYMARFNSRVLPSFQLDSELQGKLRGAWTGLLERVRGGGAEPSPLAEYPLLGMVDDRFVVMRATTARGKETFVVRSEAMSELPTLSSTLVDYLDGVIYPSLAAIAEEERQKILTFPEYQPKLSQLAAQNPFQHGLTLRVPDMGPFKQRRVTFAAGGGRLAERDLADYERTKWSAARDGRVVGVMRAQRWGVAIEEVELQPADEVLCRYLILREVAAVSDRFVGEGRRGVLLRQPRLGAVLQVSGCVSNCEDAERWVRIYPADADQPLPPRARDRGLSRMDASQASPPAREPLPAPF